MTNETNYRKKANAVFFAAIMVLSMVAVGFAAAPAAAAVGSLDNGSADDVVVESDSAMQEVSYDVTVDGADASQATLIDLGPAASAGVSPSVDSVELTGGDTGDVSVNDDGIDGSNVHTVTVDDDNDDGSSHTVEVTVTYDHDTTGVSSSIATGGDVTFDIEDDDGSASTTASFNLVSEEFNDADANADSGSTFWQGQELAVHIPSSIASGEDFQIRSIDTGDDEIGGLETEFSLDSDNRTAVVDTDDLDSDDYVITSAGSTSEAIVIDNGIADGTETGSTVSDAAWEVTTQSLSTEFDDDEVTDEGENAVTEVDIDSNRANYQVDVSADGDLDVGELTDIFQNNAGNYEVVDDNADDDDDEITIVRTGQNTAEGDEIEIDFSGIDTGDYEFTFSSSDSTAEDTDSITVGEEDVDASFEEGVYTGTAGDVSEFTVELEDTDDAYIQIGDEDVGFIDVLYVEDDDDDGEVTFEVNTRALGAPGASNVYDSEDDIVDSEVHDGTGSTGASFYDEDVDSASAYADFDAYLEDLDLIGSGETGTDQLTRPLQAADYELTVSSDGNFVVNSDDESEADDEIDSALLELIQPELGDINTWVAPEDNADEDDELDDLLDAVSQREDVALDDRLVIQVEASGLYGAIAEENGFDSLEDGSAGSSLYAVTDGPNWDGEGINFEVEADDATGNQEATSLDLNNGNEGEIFVLYDNAEGQFFIVVDTSESDTFSRSIEDGDDFDVTMEYETDEDDRYEFSGSNPYDGGAAASGDPAYPYFQADSTVESTGTFSFADAEVTFDNLNDDDVLEAANVEDSEITGETNVAPGSSAEVRVSSTDASSSFRQTESADIGEDGTFSVDFDFSEQSAGDEFETTFRVAGSSVDTVDSVIAEDGEDTGAAFEVSDLNPTDVSVEQGDVIEVSATIENTGEEEATQDVTFQVDGNELGSEEVTLDGGEDTTVTFSDIDTSDLEPGDYEHGVFTDDSEQTATLTVEEVSEDDEADDEADDDEADDEADDDEADDDEADDDEADDDGDDGETDDEGGVPGFGVIVALIALIGAAMLAARRNN